MLHCTDTNSMEFVLFLNLEVGFYLLTKNKWIFFFFFFFFLLTTKHVEMTVQT